MSSLLNNIHYSNKHFSHFKMSDEQLEFKRALKKIADYLSRRAHSEKEIFLKLSKKFSSNIVEQAIKTAKDKCWFEKPEELSSKTVENLHKKNKSWNYIKAYLREKELPLPEYSREKELEKAKKLLLKKQSSLENISFEEKIKLKQFLAYRGFEQEIMRELLD